MRFPFSESRNEVLFKVRKREAPDDMIWEAGREWNSVLISLSLCIFFTLIISHSFCTVKHSWPLLCCFSCGSSGRTAEKTSLSFKSDQVKVKQEPGTEDEICSFSGTVKQEKTEDGRRSACMVSTIVFSKGFTSHFTGCSTFRGGMSDWIVVLGPLGSIHLNFFCLRGSYNQKRLNNIICSFEIILEFQVSVKDFVFVLVIIICLVLNLLIILNILIESQATEHFWLLIC